MEDLRQALKDVVPLIRLLASDQAGEVSAAVAGIKRKLAARGYDLYDVASWIESAAVVQAAPEAEPQRDPHRDWSAREWAEYWLRRIEALLVVGAGQFSEKEADFLTNVRRTTRAGRQPTPGQRDWIQGLEAKFGRREARAG